jgi:hypothetical protein
MKKYTPFVLGMFIINKRKMFCQDISKEERKFQKFLKDNGGFSNNNLTLHFFSLNNRTIMAKGFIKVY